MIERMCAMGLAAMLAASTCAAQTAATPLATATQPSTTQATTATAPAVDPEVMKILTDIERAGQKHPTIRTDFELKSADPLTGDSEERTGWVAYQGAKEQTPAGFRVHFATRKLGGGPSLKDKEDWAFDGHYWTVVKHRIRDMVRYQMVPEGETADPMRLGKGPFVLPFGQKVADVLKYYIPTTRPLRAKEPKGTTYLKLTARRERYKDVDLTRVEMWIDPKTHLPVRIASRDKKGKTTAVTFKKMQANVKIDRKKMFNIPRIGGYTYTVKPLKR